MAKSEIAVKRPKTIVNELDGLHEAIRRRAYDLFCSGAHSGDALANWLAAERALIAKPEIEVRQKNGGLEIVAALPGVEERDLEVQITPNEILIKAEIADEHRTDNGAVYISEFTWDDVFRVVHLPHAIDPNTAKANFKNGMLKVTAAIAKGASATQANVKAA